MIKYICHLWYIGGVKKYNTENGKVSRSWFRNRDETDFGSVWKQNGKWFAFHNDEQSLILQHKKNIWRVDAEHNVSLNGDVVRTFQILKQNNVIFSIKYKPKGLFFRLIDPTYDSIDAEFDDFFLYVTNMWKSWAKRPLSDYQKHFIVKNV